MREPDAEELLDRIRALPAGGPLMEAIEGAPGVHLVGGAVRDLLLGGEPFDLDLVVEGDPVAVARRIGDDVVVHDRFGTSTVRADGYAYDIGRARSETYARPGALPDVLPAELDEDLKRRDFTVNALAVALGGAEPGALRAFPGALGDLRERRLRVLHARSFIDDPTRLVRLARYRGRLEFSIEAQTRELSADAVRAGALGTVSGPRIGNELRLLARERDPVAALLALRELKLDTAIDPRFGLDDPELLHRALGLLGPAGRADRLTLATAGRRLPAGELSALLDRLGFEAQDRQAIAEAASRAAELNRELGRAQRPSDIGRVASAAHPEAIALAGALGSEMAARQWLEELRVVRLEIDGSDLLAAGVPEGPDLGRALRAALAAKLDGRARGREEELAAALRSLEESS